MPISKSEKFLIKLKVHHLGKFAPRENNLPAACKYVAYIATVNSETFEGENIL